MQRCNISHTFTNENIDLMDSFIKLSYVTFHNLGLDMRGTITYKSFPMTRVSSHQNVSFSYSCPVVMLDAVKSLWGVVEFDHVEYF